MATREQVEDFLKRLKEKIKVFDIIFRDDRGEAEHPMNYPFKN